MAETGQNGPKQSNICKHPPKVLLSVSLSTHISSSVWLFSLSKVRTDRVFVMAPAKDTLVCTCRVGWYKTICLPLGLGQAVQLFFHVLGQGQGRMVLLKAGSFWSIKHHQGCGSFGTTQHEYMLFFLVCNNTSCLSHGIRDSEEGRFEFIQKKTWDVTDRWVVMSLFKKVLNSSTLLSVQQAREGVASMPWRIPKDRYLTTQNMNNAWTKPLPTKLLYKLKHLKQEWWTYAWLRTVDRLTSINDSH